MAEIKLKPCPFCGGEAEIEWNFSRYYFENATYLVRCTKCDCELGGIYGFETKKDAAKAWNRRSGENG